MSQRVNLVLTDILGWVLTVLKVFAIVGLLLGRIEIPSVLVAEALLFGIGYVVGAYEHALRKVLQPEEAAALEDAVRNSFHKKEKQ